MKTGEMDGQGQKSSDEDEVYVVESIARARNLSNGKREFLVKWKGFPLDRDEWQPEENLKDCKALDVFERKHGTLAS